MDFFLHADPDVIWRIFNALLSVLAIILMTRQTIRIWNVMSGRARLLTQAHIALLVSVVGGSIESIFQDNPIGIRTGIITAACAWTIYALVATPHAFTKDEENR